MGEGGSDRGVKDIEPKKQRKKKKIKKQQGSGRSCTKEKVLMKLKQSLATVHGDPGNFAEIFGQIRRLSGPIPAKRSLLPFQMD